MDSTISWSYAKPISLSVLRPRAMEKYMNEDKIANILLILIALVIVGLKITGVITLSWFWLFFPIIALFILGIVIAVIFAIIMLIYILLDKGD